MPREHDGERGHGVARDESPVRIVTPRLVLTMAGTEDIPRILAFYERNRAHLARWEPPQAEGFATEPYWRDRLARFRSEERDNVSLRLFLFPSGAELDGPMLGLVSFTRFFALPRKSAQLGYAIDREHEGKGLMSEAVAASLAHLARVRGLARVTATYQVDNARSARVLARLGFVVDRLLPSHLFTDGAWRDHTLVYRDFEPSEA